jgi:hypothetical protein
MPAASAALARTWSRIGARNSSCRRSSSGSPPWRRSASQAAQWSCRPPVVTCPLLAVRGSDRVAHVHIEALRQPAVADPTSPQPRSRKIEAGDCSCVCAAEVKRSGGIWPIDADGARQAGRFESAGVGAANRGCVDRPTPCGPGWIGRGHAREPGRDAGEAPQPSAIRPCVFAIRMRHATVRTFVGAIGAGTVANVQARWPCGCGVNPRAGMSRAC